jgi:hypothetical protein
MVGRPTSAFTAARTAPGSRGRAGSSAAGDTPPVDTWMAAQPRAFSAWPKATVLSRSQPPSTQSVAETRTHTGLSAGNAARTRRTPRAGSACGSPGCRRRRRRAGWPAATGTGAAGSRAPCIRCRRAQARGAPRGRDEVVAHALQAVGIQRERRVSPAPCGTALTARGLPAAGLAGRICAPPSHGARLDRLAARMRQLDRDMDRRMRAHRVQHARQRRLVGVGVQAQVLRARCGRSGDTAVASRSAGRRPRARGGPGGHVPVGRRSFLGRVLAHRRDDDAVGQAQARRAARG